MPELNIDLDYFEHPKVQLLVELCGGDWAEIIPIRLWRFTAKYHSATGEITGPSVQLIERSIAWKREKGRGIAVLVESGFLEPIEGGFRVHDFLEHQGHIAAHRARGKMAAEARWGKMRAPPGACSNATGMPQACNRHRPSNARTDGANGADETDGADGAPRDPPSTAPAPMGPPEDLGQRFWFRQLGGKESEFKLSEAIAEMIRVGYAESAIRAEIDRDDRDRSERFFKLKDRLEKSRPKTAKSRLSGTMAVIEEERRKGVAS